MDGLTQEKSISPKPFVWSLKENEKFNTEIERIWKLRVNEGTSPYQPVSISSVMKDVHLLRTKMKQLEDRDSDREKA